jgi:hypothetical protein
LLWLDGCEAEITIPKLEEGVNMLGTTLAPSYWSATPGNAGYWLAVMLQWAKLHPKAKWMVHK